MSMLNSPMHNTTLKTPMQPLCFYKYFPAAKHHIFYNPKIHYRNSYGHMGLFLMVLTIFLQSLPFQWLMDPLTMTKYLWAQDLILALQHFFLYSLKIKYTDLQYIPLYPNFHPKVNFFLSNLQQNNSRSKIYEFQIGLNIDLLHALPLIICFFKLK